MLFSPRLQPDERSSGRLAARALLPALLALVAADPAVGLDPAVLPSQYVLDTWTDELPQRTVRAIAQTPDGYLWLGTQDGLARFDGQRFVVFNQRNTPALGTSDIRALLVDRRGRLVVATRGAGAVVMSAGTVEPLVSEPTLADALVYSLAEGGDGSLWLGTRGHGLIRVRGQEVQRYGEADGLPSQTVLSVFVDRQGSVLAGSQDRGLSRLEGQRFVPVSPAVLGHLSVTTLAEDQAHRLWIGTRQAGLFLQPEARSESARPITSTAGQALWALLADRDGSLFAGTLGSGLLRLAGDRITSFNTQTGLPSDSVVSLFEDREGNLWVGTEGGGLLRLRDSAFRTFGKAEGLPVDQVWTVLEDRTGVIWVGTDGGGLVRIQEARVSRLSTRDGLLHDSVTALFEDSAGDLWVGTQGNGLNRIRDGRVTSFASGADPAIDTVLAMAEDGTGGLWLGTRTEGLYRFRQGRFERPTELPELANVHIWSLARGAAGELLIGTDGGGLLIVEGGKIRSIARAEGLAAPRVAALYAEPNGVIWIGTDGGGLARYAAGRLTTYDSSDGLSDDVVWQILDDHAGNLWLSTNRGVMRVAKVELEAFADGATRKLTGQLFGKSDGMRAAECNGVFQPAGFRGRDGRLWFPTTAGVVVVDPAHLPRNTVPPGVVLEEVRLDGEPTPLGLRPELSPSQRRLEFHYAGLSFVDPARVRFRYRMEGYDADWIEAGGDRHATYTSLPAGRSYTFRVTAANNDGLWSEQGAAFAFAIAPRLYQRPFFQLLAAALLAFFSWSLYKLRVRQLLHRTEQLESLVAERTAEVVAQRDELESANAELTRLNQFKSEFLGIAAHDLKNPLSVIYGYAGLMASKSAEDPGLAKVARRISASANQMLTIVSDLLDTTAMESGKLRFDPEPTDLAELATSVAESLRVMAADRQIELRVATVEGALATVDREKMTRIVQNLVSNAVRYSKAGTVAEVRVEARGEGAERRVRLAVIDQGPGLSPEQVARIFDRFERLAAKHHVHAASTGLGLSIVKQFVEMHGGRIWVESSPGSGSTFFVELPASKPPTAARSSAGTPPP